MRLGGGVTSTGKVCRGANRNHLPHVPSNSTHYFMAEFDLQSLLNVTGKLLAAFALALPVAWEREKRTRLMGLRTFPIVAMATCGYLLIGQDIAWDSPDAQARVIQGLVTGMGFIGGGAILKQGGSVKGTATASSLWATGGVGMAVAYGRFDIAVALSLIIFLVLRFLTPVEKRVGKGDAQSESGVDQE